MGQQDIQKYYIKLRLLLLRHPTIIGEDSNTLQQLHHTTVAASTITAAAEKNRKKRKCNKNKNKTCLRKFFSESILYIPRSFFF